ncbi:sensor histidine kinase [Noviherbaspirillum pedocola]|uniref:histidine kinase n=1 Tax=Noviherbaspirillum pedocola TaxID=2801341 RepID=A0A934W545_9BURK|nr:PAS domain S-box protein [Noviherbaspirillum pedocola]MBK4739226.1 PAS domain S-box protein [Noviherbaspirillum pedocola]
MINFEKVIGSSHDDLNEISDWKALHRLSMALLKAETVEKKLERILRTVLEFHQTQYGVVSFFDTVTGALVVKSSIGLSQEVISGLTGIKPGQGCCGLAFAERHRVIVEDFESNEQLAEFRSWASKHSLRAVYSTPFYDADGHALGVISVYFDKPHTPTLREIEVTDICATTVALILDRDRSEMALRRERDRRDEVLHGMAEGLCIVDHNFNVLEMNAAAIRIINRPFHELCGKNHWTLWPEGENSELGQRYHKAMAERIPVHLEKKWKDPDGKIYWFEISAYPIDEGLALFFRDITERKRVEEELRNSEKRFKQLNESAFKVVWRTDAEGVLIDGRDAWSRYTGHEGDPNHRWYEAVHPEERGKTRERWNAILASGQASQFTFKVLRHDGNYRYLTTRAVPCKNSDGNVKEWIGTCEDVTEAVLREEELRLANQRKDQFLAVLSHELRNPLSATRMAAQLLGKPPVDAARVTHISEVIQRQVGHMSRLVEDLIDVSRVSLGLVALEKQRIDLHSVIQNAVEQVTPMMTAKAHVFKTYLPPYPCNVFGDRTRLVQVVCNLLSNAARYTPDNGNINLTLSAEGGYFLLKVVDNGIGIEPAMISELFDFFVQAKRSTDRKNGGLGLGLALVKSLVEFHGGTVNAISDGTDLGSTFIVKLPRATEEKDG